MDISLGLFCEQITSSPPLLMSVLLTLGTVLVNGWTDAPNAIATCVATRCLSVRSAIWMAAIFNFIGVFVMSSLNASVAQTITQMVNFSSDTDTAILALAASLFSIVLWAVIAWRFGIPTSESHALIAGLTGSAIAIHGSLEGINGTEWLKTVYGLALSVLLGFSLGWLICKIIRLTFSQIKRAYAERFFQTAQIFGAAATSFMHGAQDGQKFIGVIILCLFLANGEVPKDSIPLPVWLMLLCSLIMGAGTSIGGKRIIRAIGMEMVKLERYQGVSADLAASLSLLVSSLLGMPVSTTHVKTTAIMGAGAAKRISSVKISVVKDMVMTWLLTFPCCALLGFFMTKIFLLLFL